MNSQPAISPELLTELLQNGYTFIVPEPPKSTV